jgi:hypothetical protein
MPLITVNLQILLYIDPGTGSIILQAAVATVVGGAVAVRLFWNRILAFFGLKKGEENDPSDEPGDMEKS